MILRQIVMHVHAENATQRASVKITAINSQIGTRYINYSFLCIKYES